MLTSILQTSTTPIDNLTQEISYKLALMRRVLDETSAAGIRLRGTDWFSWATAGAMHTVLLAAETGIAEVFVTREGAWLLTDAIEAERIQNEELSQLRQGYILQVCPWAEKSQQETFIKDVTNNGTVMSDRPTANESSLPHTLVQHKRVLLPGEIDRYRQVGRLASEAMTEVLTQAKPDWTEYQLAGAGAAALWKRGLHPALTLVAGERRLPLYRHATPSAEKIGQTAMLVFCARGFGLYANLTRFVVFDRLTWEQEKRHQAVREIEAIALDDCKPNTPMEQVYHTLKRAYEQFGYADAIAQHHQGGTTGYLSREIVAMPETSDRLKGNMAIAWNPSVVGAKIEDTFVIHPDGSLENLTLDPNWESVEVKGRSRPLPLVVAGE